MMRTAKFSIYKSGLIDLGISLLDEDNSIKYLLFG
jgi:hypothetical protein